MGDLHGKPFGVPTTTALLFVALAILIMLPEYLLGPIGSDSSHFNKVWLEGFDKEIGSGVLYPRWLPDAWDGRGSPTFYFYPPCFFYLASIIRALTGNTVTILTGATMASSVLLVGSGLGMRAWVRRYAPNSTATAIGCAYLAAPYHLFDIYRRGALAESCVYAILPVLAIAMRGVDERRAWAMPVLSLAYAALLMSHLPVAVLTSITLVPAYALCLAAGDRRRATMLLARLAIALALGICLSAIYLLPALGLIRFTSTQAMWSSFFSPELWFFTNAAAWVDHGRLRITLMTMGLLLAALGSAQQARSWTASVVPWVVTALVCFILISGLLPIVWRLDVLRKVQFPWRALVVMEFAVLTAVAITRPWRNVLFWIGSLMLGAAALIWLVGFASQVRQSSRVFTAAPRVATIDGPEYLPIGFPIATARDRPTMPQDVELPPLRVPVATAGRVWGVAPVARGEWRLRSLGAGIIIAPEFYFPHWTVIDRISGSKAIVYPCTRHRLACWKTSGRRAWVLTHASIPVVQIGAAVSSAAALVIVILIGAAVLRARDRRLHVTA